MECHKGNIGQICMQNSQTGIISFLTSSSKQEIINNISTLEKWKRYNNITSVMVKSIANFIVEPLVFLTNFSLNAGEFTKDL